MTRKTIFVSLLASSALTLAVATPALADKSDRAREAIAAAEAKLHTAEGLGAGTEAPADTAQARALLAKAREDFASDHNGPAIEEAIQASQIADTVIGESQQHKNAAIAQAREAQRATAENARDQIDQAQGQAAAAQDQMTAAQQQAAAAQDQAQQANARADQAQQSAAASAAAADAARAAAQTPPPQVQTTVTTEQATNTHHPLHKKVVRTTTTSAAPAPTTSDQVTATTTVTPQ